MNSTICVIIFTLTLMISCTKGESSLRLNELPVTIVADSSHANLYQEKEQIDHFNDAFLSPGSNALGIRNTIIEHCVDLSNQIEPNELGYQIKDNYYGKIVDDVLEFLYNDTSDYCFEVPIKPQDGLLSHKYLLTYKKVTFSHLNLHNTFRIAYNDTPQVKAWFLKDEDYFYSKKFDESIKKDTMTFYRYTARIAYHFTLEKLGNKEERYAEHLIIPVYYNSSITSPIELK